MSASPGFQYLAPPTIGVIAPTQIAFEIQQADNHEPIGGAVTPATRTRPQVAIMNAVHDLPVLVARDKGFFRDEGLDLDFVTTPGMAQVTTSHTVKFDSVFERPLDSVYNEGDRKSTRLNSSHLVISYAVFCLKKKKKNYYTTRKLKNDSQPFKNIAYE